MANTINNTADSSNKIPDKKLYIGAKMGLITNIITIVWVIIQAILIFTLKSMFFDNEVSKLDPTGMISNWNTMFTVVAIIGTLIVIGISILLIIMCNNVLKGKAKSGLTVGIVMLVLGGLMLIGLTSKFNSVTGVNIIFIGLNIAAGVLLVMGKYEPNKETTTEAVPSVASVAVE